MKINFLKNIFCITVISLFALCEGLAAELCSSLFVTPSYIEKYGQNPILKKYPEILEGIQTKNENLIEYLLKTRLENLEEVGWSPYPEKINKIKYKLITYLGEGRQGEVVLAKNEKDHLVVIKYFENSDEALEHRAQMNLLRKNGISTLKVRLTHDEIVIQDYVEGVPFDVLEKDYKQLGLKLSDLNKLKKELRRIEDIVWAVKKRSRGNSAGDELSFRDFNVLYEFSSGKLVLIDGR